VVPAEDDSSEDVPAGVDGLVGRDASELDFESRLELVAGRGR
jgi:hypothetical protein